MEFTKEQIEKNRQEGNPFKVEPQDRDNPHRPQVPLQADDLLREDENTIAKSIVDEIIEETEAECPASI